MRKWKEISIQKCTAEVIQANLWKYLSKLKRLRNGSWGSNDFKEKLFNKWQHNTKLCLNYSKCSSILMVLGNVHQYPGYPGYQLLEALGRSCWWGEEHPHQAGADSEGGPPSAWADTLKVCVIIQGYKVPLVGSKNFVQLMSHETIVHNFCRKLTRALIACL